MYKQTKHKTLVHSQVLNPVVVGSPAGTAQQKPQELRPDGGEFVFLPTGPELRVYLCTSSEERAYGANKQVRLGGRGGEGEARSGEQAGPAALLSQGQAPDPLKLPAQTQMGRPTPGHDPHEPIQLPRIGLPPPNPQIHLQQSNPSLFFLGSDHRHSKRLE